MLDLLQVPSAGFGVTAAFVISIAAFLAAAIYRPKLSTALNVAWERVVPHVLAGHRQAVADSFIAGLAVASYAKPLSKSARVVADGLVSRYVQEKSNGALRYSLLRALLRLSFSAQARGGSGGALVSDVCAFLDMVAEQRFPAYLVDGVFDDARLVSFLDGNAALLRWHLLLACRARGWSPDDVISLKGRSKAVARLLDRSPAMNTVEVALAFASLELRDELRAMGGIHSTEHSNAHSFEAHPELIAFARDGGLKAAFNGLYYCDMCLEQKPNLNVCELTTFVRTGWTHQRVDGGPDMRYSYNPPVGYNRVTGYKLQINGRTFNFAADPRPIMRSIEVWSEFYFHKLRPRALQIQQKRATIDFSRVVDDLMRCSCGKRVTFREGDFAGTVDA